MVKPIEIQRDEDLERAMLETSTRLTDRGVRLTGDERSGELVALLEAVERFERAVECRGGDLFVDEPPRGSRPQPDDVHFNLPAREPGESVADYLRRIEKATEAVRLHPPIDG